MKEREGGRREDERTRERGGGKERDREKGKRGERQRYVGMERRQ